MTTRSLTVFLTSLSVVEAYRLDRYDNFLHFLTCRYCFVVEAYRLDRYDNFHCWKLKILLTGCRSLSFG